MSPVKNNLVALGSAAVVAVYAAGYVRTQSAADRLMTQGAERRPPVPAPVGDSAHGASGAPRPRVEPAASPAAPAQPRDGPHPSAGETVVHPTAASHAHPATAPVRAADSSAAPNAGAAPGAAPPALPAPAPVPIVTRDSSSKGAATQAADSTNPAADQQAPAYKDGEYTGWGSSRHGDIQALVEIRGGRIAAASIRICLTQYSCSWIAELPPQVVARQSPETDFVSGATQSTNAFYYAVVQALAKAK